MLNHGIPIVFSYYSFDKNSPIYLYDSTDKAKDNSKDITNLRVLQSIQVSSGRNQNEQKNI